MKILQVSHKYPFPPKDGGAIAMLNLADGFARARHEVSLLAMKTPKHGGRSITLEMGTAYLEIYSVFVDTSIKPFRLLSNLLFSRIPYNAERFINREFRDKLMEILRGNSFDIIQLEGLYLMPYADTIRRFSKAKISLRSHNIEHEVWKRIAQQASHKLLKPYYNILARRMKAFETSFINRYDLLVPISGRDYNFYTRLGNTKPSCVIPVGMDTSVKYTPARFPEKKTLLFIGSLDYIPNQEGLIWFIEKVWKKFPHAFHGCTFNIAGRNAPPQLKKYLKRQPVKYVGEVDDAFRYMHSGGVMVVPLLSGGGIRVRIIEAMALGIPVVTTSIGAEGLDVTDGSNILIADDPEVFSNAVISLLEDRTFFTNMGKNARIFVEEKMDGSILASQLLKFYRSNR